jgi:HPt (histidine-containing phosphotransfer) domain-containing protein
MEVPPEILSRYMERRKRDLEVCLVSLEFENFNELEKVGHQLKGNGVTFGHNDLSLIGNKLEEAAARKNIAELEVALKDFSHWVNGHIN